MRGKIIGLLLVVGLATQAQEIKVNGGFQQDSLMIGEPIQFWVSARYPAELDMILPDSNFNFAPFEFLDRTYFETKADSSLAVDSVVYSLQSFEIDLVQYLSLPGIVLTRGDSTIVDTRKDSIYFRELAPVVTDSTKLIANTDYVDVSREINSPLLMIIGGALILIALIVLIVFGKKIRQKFLLKRMQKAHTQFIEQLAVYISKLKEKGEPEEVESAIGLWKSYLEKLEKKPITKLTSKEIVGYDFAAELTEPLKAVDRCVYGRMPSDKIYLDFQHLEGFAQNRYEIKVEKIKHGE